jgi:Na+/H+-translocating membrane pyrophosphatase
MGCAALVGLTLFGGFLRNSFLDLPIAEGSISLTDPVLFTGLLIGAIFPFLLAGLSVKASRKATEPLIE